ncbi:TPR-like protein, partial [Rhizoctonia solani]
MAQFKRSGKLDDIEKAIKYAIRALSLTPDGHPNLPDRHNALGVSSNDRYRLLNELVDLEKAIECHSRALALTPDDHPNLPDRHAALGLSYGDRYQRLGELVDLEKAIECDTRALALTPDGHLNLPDWHNALGTSYGDKYRRLGQLADLEKAMDHFSQALILTPEGHFDLPGRHAALGVSYGDLYKRLGELANLEQAMKCFSRALALTPDDHPNLPDRHDALGVSYGDRYQRLGEPADLEKAMEHFSQALILTPDGHLDLPGRHAALGVSYGDRYQRFGELADLEKAIECDSRALALTPDSHPRLPDRHAALGVSYTDRYRRLGQLADLEKAIESKARALSLTSNSHPSLQDRHAALGVSYTDRYRRLGELADLEKAIESKSRALALTPDGHPRLPDRYAALGLSYGDRYQRLGELADLEQAIESKSRALACTPDGHPGVPDRHAALGLSYSDRYQLLDELADLEKVIDCYSRALALTPDGHPNLPDRHAALGVSYGNRHNRLGELADLERAMEYFSRALALTPEGHPDSSARHENWALSCHSQYQHTHDPSHLDSSLRSFRKASQLHNGPPRQVFDNAIRWANLASKHSYLDPIEAFGSAIELLPHFIWLGATTAQRYYDLSSAQDLAVRAASAAILSFKYNLALEWLEHARCVVWAQSLMLRSPVDVLLASHPELATQLQSIGQQLHQANSQLSSSQSVTDVPEYRHGLARKYNDLVAQARKLPGFEEFLLPTKACDLIKAARNGPIVVINCEENCCDALLVIPGSRDVVHLPLPGFTGTKAQRTRLEMDKSIRNRRPSERGMERRPVQEEEIDFKSVLADLWNDIVKPVLDFLEYTHKDEISPNNMPHVTWCPTGALSFLPLHAAGDYDQPRSRAFNYVVSSYIPTLTALLSSSPSALGPNSRVLVIGQEATPGHQQLPGTTKELESVVCHIQGMVGHSQLLGEQATITTVLDAMEQHDWVHIACHAHQNVQDPTGSGFFLHDGTLDLASINQRSLKNKGLAFLSACQTATGDEQLPDEAIHLASGMLTAGYSSVIATMWSVYDDDAPLVADRVYEQLMKDGRIGNGEAGRALHNAVGELRDKVGEKEYSRWVPYIHIGS